MIPARQGRAGFGLRLEHGLGRLVLGPRRVADLLTVDDLQVGIDEVPSRLDMTAGVDRFRHHRGRLEQLRVHIEDHDLGRALRAAASDTPLVDLEVRATDGDVVVLGSIAGPPSAPFVARARLEPAGIGRERSLLFSFYELRVFGPARLSGPQLASTLLEAFGLAERQVGPTVAAFDPVDLLLREVCAELGWKQPRRGDARISAVGATAGRVHFEAARQVDAGIGPRGLGSALHVESSARARAFLADYEAKSLYASIEALVAEGQIEAAVAAYERQLEIHPGNPFVVSRLLQLMVSRPETLAEAGALARDQLSRHPDDREALCAMAVVAAVRGQPDVAAEGFERLARTAAARDDAIEAAQAWCAVAALVGETQPTRAVEALESALALRRRLPGALRALADLHAGRGDWAASLRVRERLLAGESEPAERARLLVELGSAALEHADDADAARAWFERAIEAVPDEVAALRGLAEAQTRLGHALSAVRTLDRAAQLLRDRGAQGEAANVMVRLGDLWRESGDGDPATAGLRYRQALMLSPGHPRALLGLAECAVAEGEPVRARGHLEELLRLAGDDARGVDRAEVCLRLGHLLADALGDPLLAVAYFQKALAAGGPAADEAVAELERIHAEAERWDDLARVLALAAERAGTVERRGVLLTRLASVVRAHLGDPVRAERILGEASLCRPGDLEVLRARADLHRATGDREALVIRLAELAEELREASELAAVYSEQGDLLRVHLNRTDDAIEAYTLALGCDPDARPALEGLADIYRERELHAELATLLERLARVLEGPSAGAVWLELGHLQNVSLNRPRAARESLEQAVDALDDDLDATRALADLLFQTGDAAAALPRYEALWVRYEDEGYDEPPAVFLMRLAAVYDRLRRTGEALDCLSQAAALDPDRVEVFEQAQDVLLREGDVAAIVDFFRVGFERASRPEVRAFLSRRAGRLAWRELRRPEEAATLLDAALEIEPDEEARRMRLEVATAMADWPRVAQLLRAELEDAEPAARPGLLTNLAKLAHQHLDRPEEARQLAEAALAESPDYAPALALLEEVVGVLEPEPQPEREPEAAAPPGREPEPAPARVELHSEPPATAPPLSMPPEEESLPELEDEPPASITPDLTPGPEDELIRLEASLEAAPPERKAARMLAIAEHIRDAMADPEGAKPVFRAVLEVAVPGDEAWTEAMEALEDLHAVAEEWDSLIGLYDLRIESGVGDPSETELLKASMLRAAGRLDEAIEAAERAQGRDERALDLWVHLLVEVGREAEAAEHLLEDVERLAAEDRAAREWRAAELLADSAPGRALRLMQRAAETLEDPVLRESWLALARTTGVPEALVAALEAQADALPVDGVEGVRRSGLLFEAAQHAADLTDVRRLLERALLAWPENIDAMTALAELLERLDDRPALAAALGRQVHAALPGPHRGDLAIRVAEIYVDEGLPAEARPYLEIATEDRPHDPLVEALRDALEDLAPAALGPDTEVELQVVRPRESSGPDPMSDPEDVAGGPVVPVTETTPLPPVPTPSLGLALQAVEGASEGARRVELNRIRQKLDALVENAATDAERAGLLSVRGELWRARLGHVERARADLELAVRLVPDSPEALISLGFIAMDRGDPETAARHLQDALSAQESVLGRLPAQKARTAFSVLERALDRLGQGPELTARAAAILAARPDCVPAVLALKGRATEEAFAARRDAALAELERRGRPIPSELREV